MRPNITRTRLLLGASVAAFAAVAVPGALGVSARDVAVAAAAGAGLTDSHLITTIAGTGRSGSSGDGGPALKAELYLPKRVAVDGQGNIYIADSGNHNVRKITACGTITTIAGVGTAGFSGDGGPATKAQLNLPFGVAVDSKGNVYIVEKGNNRVRKVTPNGTISTFAGTGYTFRLGDGGPAIAAALYNPWDVAVDRHDNVYIADTEHDRVRKVTPDGTISTIAGGGLPGPGADRDGIAATSAYLDSALGIGVDTKGNVYVTTFADAPGRFSNGLVRKIDATGRITTVVGTTDRRSGATIPRRRPATKTPLHWPQDVVVDGSGNLYVSEAEANVVRKVRNGVATVVAGSLNGYHDYVGDGGPARNAMFYVPGGLAIDPQGNLIIADTVHGVVRKIWASTPNSRPKVRLGGATSQRPLAQRGVQVTATCDKPCTLTAAGSISVQGTTLALQPAAARQAGTACPAPLLLRISPANQAILRKLLTGNVVGRATITIRASDDRKHTTKVTRAVAITP